MSMSLLSTDIIKYIIEEFLDIKSQVRFANTSIENYKYIDEYLYNKYNIYLKNIYFGLNINCKKYYHYIKDNERYYIDPVLIHFKDTCGNCILHDICKECKSLSTSLVETACKICISEYGRKYSRYMFGDWEESDCCGKKVCGYDADEFRGERCFYECDFCGIIQNEENFDSITEEGINKNGWMIKPKEYSEEIIQKYKLQKELIELDIFYNYVYACSKCYSNLYKEEKSKYKCTFIDLEKDQEYIDEFE